MLVWHERYEGKHHTYAQFYAKEAGEREHYITELISREWDFEAAKPPNGVIVVHGERLLRMQVYELSLEPFAFECLKVYTGFVGGGPTLSMIGRDEPVTIEVTGDYL